jgi:hypothetical protein
MDVGWKWTKVGWFTRSPESKVCYLHKIYSRGQQEPSIHAAAIREVGAWIPGVIDPAAAGRSQKDGQQLIHLYRGLGLRIYSACNAVDAGITKVWMMLQSGQLKVFEDCDDWFEEFRKYRRDLNGNVVKQDDHAMDLCLSGDTLVSTEWGSIPIRLLVGRSGFVRSHSGSLARFVGARLTIRDSETVLLKFGDGSEVISTPDHPFLTPDGWIRADCMMGQRCYNGVSQSIEVERWESELFRQPFRNFADSVIISAEGIIREMGSASMWPYGRLTTDVVCQADPSYIIETTTAPTTAPQISNSWPSQNIPATIKKVMEGRFPKRPSKPLENGTVLLLENAGIRNTTGESRQNYTKTGISSAHIVYNHSQRPGQDATDSVQTDAALTREKHLALIMKNGLALAVAQVLWRIVTKTRNGALDRALDRCISVKNFRRSDVYSLTVPGPSSFCISSGQTVHNTRYFCLSGMDLMRMPNQPDTADDSTAHDYARAVAGGAWMI